MAHFVSPAVSVIIPAFNASATIGEALESVFAQTRSDFEVIVVDDGSDDRAALEAALRPWRARLDLFRQTNQGAGATRNLGTNQARARLLAFLDADDAWEPEFLARQLSLLNARPELDMVWTDGWIHGATPLAGRSFLHSVRSTEPPTFDSLVRQTCTVLTSSVVVRRRIVDAAGGFDPAIRRGQDFDLWLRLAHGGAVMAIRNEPLVRRRVHASNLSGDAVTELRRAIAVLGGLGAKLDLTRAETRMVESRIEQLASVLELELAKRALRAGDIEVARRHLTATGAAGNWKTRLAAVGLRLTPELMRRAYLFSSSVSAGRTGATPT